MARLQKVTFLKVEDPFSIPCKSFMCGGECESKDSCRKRKSTNRVLQQVFLLDAVKTLMWKMKCQNRVTELKMIMKRMMAKTAT